MFLVVNRLHCPPTTSFCWESLPQPPEALHQVLHARASPLGSQWQAVPCSNEHQLSPNRAQVDTRQAARQSVTLRACSGAARHARPGLPDILQPDELRTDTADHMVRAQSMRDGQMCASCPTSLPLTVAAHLQVFLAQPPWCCTVARLRAPPDVAGAGEGAAQAAVDGVVGCRGRSHLEDVRVVVDRRVAIVLVLRGVAVHHQVL